MCLAAPITNGLEYVPSWLYDVLPSATERLHFRPNHTCNSTCRCQRAFRETLVGILMLYAAPWAHETMQLSIVHCLYYFHVDFVCAFGNTLERTHSQSQCWPWKGPVLPAPCSWIGQQENRKCDVHPLDALAGCTGSRLSRDMQRTGRELLRREAMQSTKLRASLLRGFFNTDIFADTYTHHCVVV